MVPIFFGAALLHSSSLQCENLLKAGARELRQMCKLLSQTHRSKSTKSGVTDLDYPASHVRANQSKQAAEDYTLRKNGARSPTDARLDSGDEFIWQPMGIGLIAEARIQAGIREGQLKKLKGAGKPLKLEDHSAQFFRVDPAFQALMRTFGAQNVRPESATLREELRTARAAFAGRARELSGEPQEELETDGRLVFLFDKFKQKIVEYNRALLKDRETYPGWPLLQHTTNVTLLGEVESIRLQKADQRTSDTNVT